MFTEPQNKNINKNDKPYSQAGSTLDDLGNRLKPLINNYTIKKIQKKIV
jgi:hypothetical protein